ncbi:MAG: ROK family protein [Alphaproteobacteria bacterium]|nr:ROK family protein [Alphaproteobacteria bacterium]
MSGATGPLLRATAIARADPPFTLAIDIGGSHIKASVLDRGGAMVAAPVRVRTPRPATPEALLRAIAGLARTLPSYDRISAGFPGYVRHGQIRTAPNLGTESWAGFRLDRALARRLKKPARVLNDADVQGLGAIEGRGLECVLTLGTGIGSALFQDGSLLPHLELGQHPIAKNKTYDQYLGNAIAEKKGRRVWNRRLRKTIDIVRTLVNFDRLYLGGGNTRLIDFDLPRDVKITPNADGIVGGVRLWNANLDPAFERPRRDHMAHR